MKIKPNTALVAVGALALALTPAVAFAGGSDAPTPYTVTEAGITLPEGVTFPESGHVNIKVDGEKYGIHFDPNKDHPGSKWIGESLLPWSAFGVDSGCVEWVQYSDYNQHFGEGGQSPVCFGETPEPDPTPAIPELSREFSATCDAFDLVATSTVATAAGRYEIKAQEYAEDGQTLLDETTFEGAVTWGEKTCVDIPESEALLLWVYRVDLVDSPHGKTIVGEYPLNCLPVEEEPGEEEEPGDEIPLIPLEPATPIEDDEIPLTPLEPATPVKPEPTPETPSEPAPDAPQNGVEDAPKVNTPGDGVEPPSDVSETPAPKPVIMEPRTAG